MTATGTGVLAIWHDIDPAAEAEVIEWYNREHHFERVGTVGFRRVRRYAAISGAPKYFIAYETDLPETMASQPYLERANAPSEWSRRSMPHFRNNHRTVCKVTWRSAGPDGGAVVTLRLAPKDDQDAVRRALTGFVQGTILPLRGILKAQLWEADQDKSTLPTGDKALRDHPDRHSTWALIVSGIDTAALNAALTGYLLAALPGLGIAAGAEVGLYQLQAAVEKESLTSVG